MNILKDLDKTLLEFQQLARDELVQQLIIALRKYYRFEEILNAIANYTSSRQDWESVTRHLRESELEVLKARARLQGTKQQDDE